MQVFNPSSLSKLYKREDSPNNGQITIIGGSDLFHGAPILALQAASRIVDMVYFSSPEPANSEVAAQLKSKLSSFIWVPWEELPLYIKKSDAILIGPGMRRYHSEKQSSKFDSQIGFDGDGDKTREITENFLKEFPDKRWVIDGGSLQVIDARHIPKSAVVTPNGKEYKILFGQVDIGTAAKDHDCTIVLKGPVTTVCSPDEQIAVEGGNNGLTKGGTGDLLAGVTVGLLAKNDPFLAATVASWAVKKAADNLLEKVGTMYNADDVAEEVTNVLGKYLL